jgi:hypothetical protein
MNYYIIHTTNQLLGGAPKNMPGKIITAASPADAQKQAEDYVRCMNSATGGKTVLVSVSPYSAGG